MVEQAAREILWNVSHPLNTVVMYGLFALSLVIGGVGVFRHVEIWRTGRPAPEYLGAWATRLIALFTRAGLQREVIKSRLPAIAHTLIYLGFAVLLFTTTMVMIDHDFGIPIYRGRFYLAVTLLSDIFGFGLLLGCLVALHRRLITRADLVQNRAADYLVIWVLILLIVQGFLLEGLRIHATDDPWAAYSPIGTLVAQFLWPISKDGARIVHFATWWFHTITVFAVFAIVPYTKFFHIFASSASLYFHFRARPLGALSNPGDLEKMLETGEDFSIGRGSIKDYTWKELLELDACTSCGRCQDACPAYRTGKPLSPKWVILDSRNHMLALQANDQIAPSVVPEPLKSIDQLLIKSFFLPSNGLKQNADQSFSASGEYRGKNPAVQEAALKIGGNADARIASEVINADAFWACTTCMACVEACPVGINHVDQIVENRRNLVLMQGELPAEAQNTLRALESRGNPYGPPEDRMGWAKGLDVPVLKPGDSVKYLYWVGCVSSYDQRKQKIARSLVTLLKKADLNFAVLGERESCTGDPARRLGEENLFQSLAKRNLEILRSVRFEYIVANCPHCFNTLKNEYPQLGNLGDGRWPTVIHHSRLLEKLLAQGKLTPKDSEAGEITFHDPCYLGRYNGEYDAPREVLKSASSLKIVEMDESRNRSMCCGAGGGHYWMDLKQGERVNVARTDQAAATGAGTIATGCPFCMQMMEDGVNLTGREDQIVVKDIAEVLLERL